jgi:Ca2+-binding RTX toxin-like protein
MATIDGGNGNDDIFGYEENDEIRGFDGNDAIAGGEGDDFLRGMRHDDYLYGEEGADELWGGDDNDHLTGGGGFRAEGLDDGFHDILEGQGGDDHLYYAGEDHYDGGTGFDTFSAGEFGYAGNRNVWFSPIEPILPGTDWYGEPTPRGPEGIRMDLETGVAERRGTGAATENFYAPGATPIGTGQAEFESVERYELTDFGDYYAGDNTGDQIVGYGGNDIIEGRGGADAIDGGTGSDTVEYGSSAEGVNVDLVRGTGLLGDAEGDTYTSIENIRGSNQLDFLSGDDNANTILGRGGDDRIEGHGGGDVLDGGDGVDTVLYTFSPNGVMVFLRYENQDFGTSDSINDTLRNIENVTGSAHDDYLQGSDGANELHGSRGDDVIDGAFGNDTLIGGNDPGTTDWVSFQSWYLTDYTPGSEIIRIALADGIREGSATRTRTTSSDLLERDALFGFENVIGSDRAETIIGNSGANTIEGRGGSDIIDGGRGNDNLLGGGATDTLSFESLDALGPAPINDIVRTDLVAGTATRIHINYMYGTANVVETDTLSGFENVRGSNYQDEMSGDGFNNVLEGWGGNDVLAGSVGSDTLNGGDGIDTASYQNNPWYVIAFLGATGTPGQAIEFAIGQNGILPPTVDTLLGIENLRGSNFNDTLYGNEVGNVLDGRGGADDMRGGGGSDIYMVDAGDILTESGGQGIDTVRTSTSYTLTAGADIEIFETTNRNGVAAINLTGNNAGNEVIGNNGNNVLNGSGGRDFLTGLGGQDQFVFNTTLDAARNVDEILDFAVGVDTIVLENAVFTALPVIGNVGRDLTAAEFVTGTAAQDASDRIIYNSATGGLFYDSDGVGGAAAIQFAEVTPGLVLTNQDFLVV